MQVSLMQTNIMYFKENILVSRKYLAIPVIATNPQNGYTQSAPAPH